MKYIFTILSVFAFTLFVYWVSGGEFERNKLLATTLSIAAFVSAVSCAVVTSISRDNQK